MSERFYLDTPVGDASTAILRDDEARHLTKVMRAKKGDEITLFDGSGCEFLARIASLEKNSVTLEIISQNDISRELPGSLTLAVGLPKGDRQRFLVEKLVELGVTKLIPLETTRGVAEVDRGVLDRLRRQVVEASKQCQRNRLMEIVEPFTVETLVRSMNSISGRLFAHPSGSPWCPQPQSIGIQEFVVAIGAEGGFTEAEVQLAREAEWQILSLGQRILRVETAAISVAAILGNAMSVER